VFLVIGLVLAAALAIGLFTSLGTGKKSGAPSAGSPAPAFTLGLLGGGGQAGTPADGGGNGRPAVLLFFASWCSPCQSEIPAVAALYRQQVADHGPLAKVSLLGVDGLDPTGSALAFVHKSGVTFPVVADEQYAVTEGKYDFTGEPEAVFIGPDGTIDHITYGPVSTRALLAWARSLPTH